MPWQSPSMQKSNSSGLTSEELLIRSSSYSVLQNYMHIPTKFLLSPYFSNRRKEEGRPLFYLKIALANFGN